MTTIAFDGNILASDSRCVGDYIEDSYKKIFKINNKYYGLGGNYSCCLVFIEWIKNNVMGDEKPKLDDNFGALVVDIKSKKVFYYDDYLIKIPQKSPCAIGSGAVVAMTAMVCGKNAIEAIEIAKRLDNRTGGRIQHYTISDSLF